MRIEYSLDPRTLTRPIPGVRTLTPVSPSKVIAVGLNYADHAREQNKPLPKEPLIWFKAPTSLIPDGGKIEIPFPNHRTDYEAELCIVMGREEADKTRTLAKIPITVTSVRVRLRVEGNQIRGQYQPGGTGPWLDAGAGELPAPPQGQAKISLHCYQGPPDAERWPRFSEFRVLRTGN